MMTVKELAARTPYSIETCRQIIRRKNLVRMTPLRIAQLAQRHAIDPIALIEIIRDVQRHS